MKKVLALIAILLFSLPVKSYGETETRFSVGYSHQFIQHRHINLLDASWKFYDEDDSRRGLVFSLSLGGGKTKKISESVVQGDLNAELFGDFLSIELPQEYIISKKLNTQYFVSQIGMDYFWSIRSGTWWKMPWDFYISSGIMSNFYVDLLKRKYGFRITIDEDQVIEDDLHIPGGGVAAGFDFYIPACANFEIELPTLRACGLIGLNQPKYSGFSVVLGFGF